jgi:hypothetical protein
MNGVRLSLVVAVLLITAHRLPAPIQEIPESPTPAPEQSPKSESPTSSPSVTEAGTPELRRVFVKKYGVSVLLPTNVFPDFEKLSNGIDSSLNDNGVSLTFYDSQKSLRQTFEDHVNGPAAEVNQNIDYKVLKDTWFVVSGDFGAPGQRAGFYTKGVKYGRGIVIMRLRYGGEESPLSDETLTAISRSFDGK